MSDKATYKMELDEVVPVRRRGVFVEHRHIGYDYWHNVRNKHDGCGRMEGGEACDVRMCGDCAYMGNVSECHGFRREYGMTVCWVEHVIGEMVIE